VLVTVVEVVVVAEPLPDVEGDMVDDCEALAEGVGDTAAVLVPVAVGEHVLEDVAVPVAELVCVPLLEGLLVDVSDAVLVGVADTVGVAVGVIEAVAVRLAVMDGVAVMLAVSEGVPLPLGDARLFRQLASHRTAAILCPP